MLTRSPILDSSRRGASLILVTVVMAALMILMVIFARLVTVGMAVTRGYSNVFKAEMAAKAGVADAQNVLLDLFTKYPDSVTYWDVRLGSTTTPGTVFSGGRRHRTRNIIRQWRFTAVL